MQTTTKQVRNAKEIRVKDCGKYSTRIGTVNRKTTDSFYIRSKIKLLNNGMDDIAERLRTVKAGFVKFIERSVKADSMVSNNTIYDIQYSDSGLTYKNMTYFKYEIFMKPNEKADFSQYEDYITGIARNFNSELDKLLTENELI